MTKTKPRNTIPRRKRQAVMSRQKTVESSRRLLESASLCLLSGRITAALEHYRAALKAERGRSQDALIGIGLCHELRGEIKKAVQFFRKARELGPLPMEDYLSIARLHSECCAFTTALAWLKDALYHYPRTEEIHACLRDTLARQSRFDANFGKLRQQIRLSSSDRPFAAFVAAHGDAQAYLDRNPDVENAGFYGFTHWLSHGLQEGRIMPGIETSKPRTKLDASRPWRYFTFAGKPLLARVRFVTEHEGYDKILKSWNYQKHRQSAAMESFLRRMASQPLISIVVPVYNTDPTLLRAMIDSVRAQRYPNWELCLADDGSPSSKAAEVLREYRAKDQRIRTVFRKRNGGIAAATNSAIGLATGTFIAFLDHDDMLDDCALLCIVKALQDHPGAKIIYTDEDKISANGVRYDPHFKPDWNRELFYAQNYISHLTVIESSVVSSAGKLKPEHSGSQDYDFLLRCIEQVDDTEIIHIPKVLYSWRAVEGSTALSANAKIYAWEAGRRALTDHLRRTSDPYSIVERGEFPFTYKPNWFITEPHLVSIIIPTRDMLALLKVAVGSILDLTTDCRFELLIVDNGSVEAETISWLKQKHREDSRVRVLRHDIPFNYSALNNFAVSKCKGDILVFMNNDIEVLDSGWLKEMVSLASRRDAGCIGAKLLYPDRTVQHGGVIVGTGGVAGHAFLNEPENARGYFERLTLRQEYSAVTGACMAIRRHIFEEVGGFNENDLTVAFNDVDLCLKVKKQGYRNIWTPYAKLIHHESASRGSEDTLAKRSRFMKEVRYMQRKWRTLNSRDPAYNINLSLHRADFSLGDANWDF